MPSERKVRDDIEYTEYKSEDAHSVVFQEVLKQMYFMYRLFNGTYQKDLIGNSEEEQVRALASKIDQFFAKVSQSKLYFMLRIMSIL